MNRHITRNNRTFSSARLARGSVVSNGFRFARPTSFSQFNISRKQQKIGGLSVSAEGEGGTSTEEQLKKQLDEMKNGQTSEQSEDGTATESGSSLDDSEVEDMPPDDVDDKIQFLLQAAEDDQELKDAIVFLRDELVKRQNNALEYFQKADEAEQKQKNDAVKMSKLHDQYKRLQAEFENFRKRSKDELEQTKQKSKASVIEDLLPLIDSFDIAFKAVTPNTPEEEAIIKSYKGLYKQMLDCFKDMGVLPVEAMGQQFDPELHEAMTMVPRDDVDDQTVVEEYRKGFVMGEMLLRAAQVVVATTP